LFIGHFALALAAKKPAPKIRLGTTVMAAQWLDLLWPICLLLGIEQVRPAPGITRFTPLDFVSYPWTHSLAMALAWSILFAVIFFAIRRDARGALLVGALVTSHWVLDYFTHRPDLPLYPGGPKVGLGLWNSIAGTVTIEVLMFVAGAAIYLTTTRAKDKIGSIALWVFLLLLLGFYVSAAVNPGSPPTQNELAWSALLMWIFVPWCYWIDRHREVK
jgi:membrane-bound metal-dependent hydrolase YbcI (DUF457 family)